MRALEVVLAAAMVLILWPAVAAAALIGRATSRRRKCSTR